jgi:hypothetical protein
MRYIHCFLFIISLLTTSVAYGQITEDPEERRDQGQAPLRSQTPEGNPLPFKDRLRFGGGISAFQIGNPFSIGLAPVVAYQASERLVVGVSLGYTYTRFKDSPFSRASTFNQYTGRLFGMYEIVPNLLPNLYAHAELDQRTYSYTEDGVSGRATGGATGTLLGATYAQPIGRLFSVNLSALYNVTYNGSDPNTQALYGFSPWVIRLQFF